MSLLHLPRARCGRVVTALVFPRATKALVRAHLPAGARVIAVDAGARALREAGVRPDLVVGDLDSLDEAEVARLEREGVRIERHPASKRDSDGALALAAAKDDDLLFLGAGGGRADHALATLHLLVAAARRSRVVAYDEDATTWVVTPDRPLRLGRPRGTTLSVLPFGERAEGVTYRGLEWHLDDATMEIGDPYGVSNRCLDPPQEVRVRRGVLVVIAPRAT